MARPFQVQRAPAGRLGGLLAQSRLGTVINAALLALGCNVGCTSAASSHGGEAGGEAESSSGGGSSRSPETGGSIPDGVAGQGVPEDLELAPALPCNGSTVRCVRAGAPGGEGTADEPHSEISEALEAAADGDTIQVAAGTYSGHLVVSGRVVDLLGGFSDDFQTRDLRAYSSTIRSGGGGAAMTLIDSGATRLEGFTISGGTGGGICVTGGAPLISANVIAGNDTRDGGSCGDAGAGINAEDADVSIIGNLIRDNLAVYGGGVATNRGSVTIDSNTIANNSGSGDHGGGMYIASTVTMSRNLIEDNKVGEEAGYGWGGGVIVFGEGNAATFFANVIRGNSAPSIGSGVFFDDGVAASMSHDIVYGNMCPEYGGAGVYVDGLDASLGSTLHASHVTIADHDCENNDGGNGVFVERASVVEVENSILWGNDRMGREFFNDGTGSVLVRYSDVDEVVTGSGNISTDPLFADAAAGDFHLKSAAGRWDDAAGEWVTDGESSPCIDAADPSASYGEEPSPNGGRADMGAYGNTAEAALTP